MKDRPKALGMIVPSAGSAPAGDLGELIPPEVRVEAVGLGLGQMSMSGYVQVIGKVEGAALDLKGRGADAIVVIGTSLTFSAGYDYHETLLEKIRSATGLPATTMSAAVADALRAVNVRRLAAATAYIDEVNQALRDFFTRSGFEVVAVRGLGLATGTDAFSAAPATVAKLAEDLYREHPEADGVLVSCGAFRVMSIIAPLEEKLGVPVVTSNQATAWAGLRLLGIDLRRPGYGRLLS